MAAVLEDRPLTGGLVPSKRHQDMSEKDDELMMLRIREAVRDGIREYHAELKITPDHWAHIRREYEKAKANRNIVRKTILGAVLTALLLFGYNAVTDHLAKVVSQHIDERGQDR